VTQPVEELACLDQQLLLLVLPAAAIRPVWFVAAAAAAL
jgi:hypothetical protein